jgi:hypothetical protein
LITGSMPGMAASTRLTCVVGRRPKPTAAPLNSLALRGDLGVDLQAHDDFPGAGAAFDQFGLLAHGA